jgi:hypothetical protein
MTRKDYILIADILREAHGHSNVTKNDAATQERAEGRESMVEDITFEFALALRRDNPRFDREHFLAVVRGEKSLNSQPAKHILKIHSLSDAHATCSCGGWSLSYTGCARREYIEEQFRRHARPVRAAAMRRLRAAIAKAEGKS